MKNLHRQHVGNLGIEPPPKEIKNQDMRKINGLEEGDSSNSILISDNNDRPYMIIIRLYIMAGMSMVRLIKEFKISGCSRIFPAVGRRAGAITTRWASHCGRGQ